MFARDEHPRTGHLSEVLEWGNLVAGPTPAVLRNKDGAYMTTLRYRGEDVTMLDEQPRAVYLHRLNELLMRLGTNWCLLFDEWHEPDTSYPVTQSTNAVACFVDRSREAQIASGTLYGTEQYLTLVWHPGSMAKQKVYERWFRSGLPQQDALLNRGRFVAEITRWVDGLQGLMLETAWLDPDATCTYLLRCASWRRHQVRCPAWPVHLAQQLTPDDFLRGDTPQLGRVVVGSQPKRLEKYLRPIGIQSWPTGRTAHEGGTLGMDIPSLLHRLPFPYRYTTRYFPLDVVDGQKLLKAYQTTWQNVDSAVYTGLAKIVRLVLPGDAAEQALSLEPALQDLNSGDVRYGFTTPVVLVWSDTEDELLYREREVLKVFYNEGLVPVPETLNASQAFFGMQPGDTKHNVRRGFVSSLAEGFLLPHGAPWQGTPWDARYNAPPVMRLSSDGMPFDFCLHPGRSELGNFLVAGPSRTGKSAWLALIASQFLRYVGAQVFCFDRQESLFPVTVLHGGTHYDFGRPGSIALQPLGAIDQSHEELVWGRNWLLAWLHRQGETLGTRDREEIDLALGILSRQPRHLRTITAFSEALQVARLKPALSPLRRGQAYGFLDADHDDLALADWTTFELYKLMQQSEILTPVLRYLFHRLHTRFDGRPTLLLFDEVRKMLEDETFGEEVMDDLKEQAKHNVSVGMATQEIADAARTKVFQAILANCNTKVFLPNPEATTPEVRPFYEACGVSALEGQFIAMGVPMQDYFVKSGRNARRVQMVLSPLDRLSLAPTRDDELAALHALCAEDLKEPLYPAWLRRNGFGYEADLFCTHYLKEVPYATASV